MNRTVSRALWAGTITGVALCAAATLAAAVGEPAAPHLARLGVLALLVTPPLRLALVSGGFFMARERRYGLASLAVLVALLAAAAHAAGARGDGTRPRGGAEAASAGAGAPAP